MKAEKNAVLVVVALLYWLGLCNASAFYDPGAQRWLNRDPLGDLGSLAYFASSLVQDNESDDSGELTGDELLGAWSQVNLNLHAVAGNNPIGATDPEGLQCFMLETEFIPTTSIAESGIGMGAKVGIDATAKVAIDTGAKASDTAGKATDTTKEMRRVQDQENPIDKAKDIQKAQDNIRQGKYEGGQIDRITKAEQNYKKALRDIANNPHLADDLSVVNAPSSTCNKP